MSYPIKSGIHDLNDWHQLCVHVYPTDVKPCTVIKMVLQYCFINKAFFLLQVAVMATAAGALIGWPFSAILG